MFGLALEREHPNNAPLSPGQVPPSGKNVDIVAQRTLGSVISIKFATFWKKGKRFFHFILIILKYTLSPVHEKPLRVGG